MVREYRLIDLFSGCGGMTLGFLWDRLLSWDERNPVCRTKEEIQPSPFRPIWANDFNRSAAETYEANFDPSGQHMVATPIEDILESEYSIPTADVVIGGPPWQGFSLLNKAALTIVSVAVRNVDDGRQR